MHNHSPETSLDLELGIALFFILTSLANYFFIFEFISWFGYRTNTGGGLLSIAVNVLSLIIGFICFAAFLFDRKKPHKTLEMQKILTWSALASILAITLWSAIMVSMSMFCKTAECPSWN